MSLALLPIDLKIKLLEFCPQLRYVLSELRNLLKKFKKLEELDYPTDQNYFREKIILTYNGMRLNFTAKFWDCILTMEEYTWSSDSVVFHRSLPYLTIGTRYNTAIMLKINDNKSIEQIGAFEGHTCSIICSAFHPFLPIMATGSSDKTVKLWNMNADGTFRCYATLTGHENRVYTVVFHPVLPLLATLCPSSRLKLWRVNDMNSVCFATLDEETDTFNSFAFHPIKPFFITGKNDVKLWKINENWSECQVEHFSEEFSENSSDEDSSDEHLSDEDFSNEDFSEISYIIHLETYEENKNIQAIVMHPMLPLFATIRIDSNVTLRRINDEGNNCEYIGTILSQRTYASSVTFHPSLPIIAVDGAENTVKIYRLGEGVECIEILEEHKREVISIAFHQVLPIMATGSKDNTIKIWRLNEEGGILRCMTTLNLVKNIFNQPHTIIFHPVLPILVATTTDRSIKIWK